MNSGDSILIQATVLRVTGNRLDAQTADGQLIQTDVSNVVTAEKHPAKKEEKPTATAKPKTDKKSVPPAENKAILSAPENKSANK